MTIHLPSPTHPRPSIATTRKMRWWYEALADYMLANPTALQNDIAAHFGRAPSTISIIINTDAFKAYFRQRRNEFQTNLGDSVKEKLMSVADRSLDAILDKLDKKRDTIPLETLNRTTELTLKSLGFGGSNSPSVVVNNNNAPTHTTTVVAPVTLADLEVARTALRNAQSQALPPVIEQEVVEVPSEETP